jgi:hypothetical protein
MSTNRITGRFAALALFAMAAVATQAHADNWSQDPTTKCRFVAPSSLGVGPVSWVGACPGGQASGVGMLRRRDGAQAGHAFYGELRKGVPYIGLVEVDGGYQIGHFADGDIGMGEADRSMEFKDRDAAFDTAIRAARAVSAHYAAQNNTESARYYEAVAKKLEDQDE